jgi:glutamyl-tRNA(Gln) amidotransferase, subunit E
MSDRVICGIEIHQQLDTKKLFCDCASHLCEDGQGAYYRRLRPTTGETGEIDRAALVQFQKGMGYRYQLSDGVSCLVELDEEPPHGANKDAMDTVLTFSSMLNSDIADEVHFMRKIVVDGSNTTGFQRTALVAMNGFVNVNGKDISILSVCLEEDAARKIETTSGEITYRLDRLGIPLIEVATGPDIRSPEEAMETALRIGTLLRATKKVKRGIGTIREDVNISIPGGARIEIKGVQELRLLPLYVENEILRQQMLLTIKEILNSRKTKKVNIKVVDVSNIFKDCQSKVIRSAFSEKGKVLAVTLPGFAGVMNGDSGKLRLGAEMAQRARTKGVKGIFHSDELPGYGIEQKFIDDLKKELKMTQEHDAFAICAAPETKAFNALTAAAERANEALEGVPEETRDPLPDGTSKYSRPLPGAARMYPETDVPPIRITAERLKVIKENLPELPEETEKRIVKEYKINAQQAKQLVRQGDDVLFEKIFGTYDQPAVIATTLLSTFTEMEREGLNLGMISETDVIEVFKMLKASKFSKEALPAVFREVVKGKSPEDSVKSLGLESIGNDEAAEMIRKVIQERIDFVKEKGMAAVGPLMGPVMEIVRGKVDGKVVSSLLTEEIRKVL